MTSFWDRFSLFQRLLVIAILPAIIGLLLVAPEGSRAALLQGAPKKPPAKAKTAAQVRARLGAFSDFPGIDDPRTTLKEVLDMLSDRHGLSFTVNKAAFKADGLNNVEGTEVGSKPLPRAKITLDRALRRVLARVPVPSGAVFVVSGNAVHITTGADLAKRRARPEPPPVNAETRKRQATALKKLKETVNLNRIDDPKTTLPEALDQLSRQHRVTIEIYDRAFAFNMIDVSRTEIARDRPIPATKTSLAKVLELILARVKVPGDKAIILLQSDGVILITTAKVRDRVAPGAVGAPGMT